jgi:hypothetical protein
VNDFFELSAWFQSRDGTKKEPPKKFWSNGRSGWHGGDDGWNWRNMCEFVIVFAVKQEYCGLIHEIWPDFGLLPCKLRANKFAPSADGEINATLTAAYGDRAKVPLEMFQNSFKS